MDDPEKNSRALEEADLPDGLPGGRHAQAGRHRAGTSSNAGARKLPLLITQNYGRGRTAIMATSGTLALADGVSRWAIRTHDLFWQQLATLAGAGVAGTGGGNGAHANFDGRWPDSTDGEACAIRSTCRSRRRPGDRALHWSGWHFGPGGYDTGCGAAGSVPHRVDGRKPGSYLAEVTARA